MNELKIEIGDNIKEVMLKIINSSTNIESTSIAIYHAFGIDFGKILKGYGKKIMIIDKKN